jgi:hypothetical protein
MLPYIIPASLSCTYKNSSVFKNSEIFQQNSVHNHMHCGSALHLASPYLASSLSDVLQTAAQDLVGRASGHFFTLISQIDGFVLQDDSFLQEFDNSFLQE